MASRYDEQGLFWIQAGDPRTQRAVPEADDSVCDAIEKSFPTRTEELIVAWNRVHIPVSYKYDMSILT